MRSSWLPDLGSAGFAETRNDSLAKAIRLKNPVMARAGTMWFRLVTTKPSPVAMG